MSRNWKLAVGLILACTGAAARSGEPNQSPVLPELVFKEVPVMQTWKINGKRLRTAAIRPTYKARLVVRWYFMEPGDPNEMDMLMTVAGKSMSDLQQDLVRTGKATSIVSRKIQEKSKLGDDYWLGIKDYALYAVSRADAEKMARAVLEFLIKESNAGAGPVMENHMEKLTDRQKQLKAQIAEATEKREEKDAEVNSAYRKYEEAVKESPYSLHLPKDVPNEVRKTVFEMGKMLDVLNVEIAGIEAKMAAIEEYSKRDKGLNNQLLQRLREMTMQEQIELVGAETRRRAILDIKKREESLYHLYNAWNKLDDEAGHLRGSLAADKGKLKGILKEKEHFVKMGQGIRPFEIADREVTVYPVGVD
jgi:hypothetical protein